MHSPCIEGNVHSSKIGDQNFIHLFIQQIFMVNTVNSQYIICGWYQNEYYLVTVQYETREGELLEKRKYMIQNEVKKYSLWVRSSHCLFLYIKFYWHMATLIHLHAVYGCLLATTAALSNFDKGHMADKAQNIFGLLYSRQFAHPWNKI